MISEDSVVLRRDDALFADLDRGEAAILNLGDGVYYGLNPVAARVWHLLPDHKTVAELRDVLSQEFEVDADRLMRDLIRLIERLAGLGLVEARSDADR